MQSSITGSQTRPSQWQMWRTRIIRQGIKEEHFPRGMKKLDKYVWLHGKGIFIAVACGVLSALLNVGFISAAPIAELAEKAGAVDRNASLAAWVVVLIGAYVMNAGYAIFLLVKNNSWKNFGIEANELLKQIVK